MSRSSPSQLLPLPRTSPAPYPPSASPVSRRSRARAYCAACLLLALPACQPSVSSPPAQVASSPPLVTGHAAYDRFFAEAGELSRLVENAQRELPEARAALARRVGLSDEANAEQLGARLRERTAYLAREGLTLELEFTGIDPAEDEGAHDTAASERTTAIPSQPPMTPTATLRTPGREPERRELRLLEVVAQAALSAAMIYAEMSAVPQRTRPLQESAPTLRAQLDQAFPDAAQRARVQAGVTDTEALLAQLDERSRTVANAGDTLISLLDEAANTAGLSNPRRRPPRETVPAKPSAPREPPPTDRPARPATPKTPPSAESAGDFEP